VEIERLRETHFDGSRAGRNFSLDRQVEPLVMESEISGLADRHAFMKYENYVTRFSFPYLDVPIIVSEFELRDSPEDKLPYDPKNLKGSKAQPQPEQLRQEPAIARSMLPPAPLQGHEISEPAIADNGQQSLILRG